MGGKDYSSWHNQKSLLQTSSVKRYFYEREVWWAAIGCNVGFEEDGKHADYSRPVLILRKYNEYFFLGLPLSTTGKTGRFYHHFETSPGYRTALLSQLRALDAKRLINKDGAVSSWDHALIRQKLIENLTKSSPPAFRRRAGGEVETHLLV